MRNCSHQTMQRILSLSRPSQTAYTLMPPGVRLIARRLFPALNLAARSRRLLRLLCAFTLGNHSQPPSFRSELKRRGHQCIMFSKGKIQVGIPGRDVRWGPRISRRLGPGLTKSSAVGSYFQAGTPALSFSLSCRDVRVSLFRRRYRLVSGLANSVSGLTRGETFVGTKL